MRQSDTAIGIVGLVARQVEQQLVGRADGQELGNIARLLGEELHRGADAAGLGMADQGLDRGQPRNADVDRQLVAFGLHRAVPGDQGRCLEAELRHHIKLGAAALGEGVFPSQRFADVLVGDVGAAFGMAGDADTADAVLVEKAGLEQGHGAVELADRIVDRAGERHDLGHTDLTGEGLQPVVELRLRRDRARREMGHRLEALITQAPADGDRIGEVRAG